MKKISLILLAAAAIFASCSKHNDAPVVEQEPWINDINLPVPIQFNTSSPGTKATADLITETFLKSRTIGIIGVQPLAYKYNSDTKVYTSAGTGGWSTSREGTIIMDNQMITTGTDGSIDTKKYYPIFSENNYSFYGYHPYSEGALTDTGFEVTYNLGYQDIVWAKSVASNLSENYPGYNAKYIRYIYKNYSSTQENHLPKLEFKHLLTALNFYAMSAETDADVANVKVSKVTVKNIPTQAKLVVVDDKVTNYAQYQGESKAGTLTPVGTAGNIVLEPAAPVQPTIAQNKIGALLVMPSEKAYTVDVTLETADGTVETVKDLVLPQTTYVAGSKYNFAIKIWDLRKIDIVATVIPWHDVPSEDGKLPTVQMPE